MRAGRGIGWGGAVCAKYTKHYAVSVKRSARIAAFAATSKQLQLAPAGFEVDAMRAPYLAA